MKPADAAEMNRLSRMTREQREEEALKAMLGPLYDQLLPTRKPAIREQVQRFPTQAECPICQTWADRFGPCGSHERHPDNEEPHPVTDSLNGQEEGE